MTKLASSETRKSATAAISSGVPVRPSGVRSVVIWRRNGGMSAVIGVSMKPGAIAFTRMFPEPASIATDFVKPMIPALAAP